MTSACAGAEKSFVSELVVLAVVLAVVLSTVRTYDNRKFEGESLFNRSSVGHGKHVTVKNNSRSSPFHISYGNFTDDKSSFCACTHVSDKDGDFLATKMWQSKR